MYMYMQTFFFLYCLDFITTYGSSDSVTNGRTRFYLNVLQHTTIQNIKFIWEYNTFLS